MGGWVGARMCGWRSLHTDSSTIRLVYRRFYIAASEILMGFGSLFPVAAVFARRSRPVARAILLATIGTSFRVRRVCKQFLYFVSINIVDVRLVVRVGSLRMIC